MKTFLVLVLTRTCQKFFIVLKSNHYQTYLNALLLKSIQYLLNPNQEKDFSKTFMYLPSALDRKEELNQWPGYVNLHLIDVSYQ